MTAWTSASDVTVPVAATSAAVTTTEPPSDLTVAVAVLVPSACTVSEPARRISPSISAVVPPPMLAIVSSRAAPTRIEPTRPGVSAVAVLFDLASSSTACAMPFIEPAERTKASTSASDVTKALVDKPTPAPSRPTLKPSLTAATTFVPVDRSVSESAPRMSPSITARVAAATVAVVVDKPTEMPPAPAVPVTWASAQFFTAKASTSTAPATLALPVAPMPASTLAWFVTVAVDVAPNPAPRAPPLMDSIGAVAVFVPLACTVNRDAFRMSPSICAFVAPPTLAAAVKVDPAAIAAPAKDLACASAVFFDCASTSTAPDANVTVALLPMAASTTASDVIVALAATSPPAPPTAPPSANTLAVAVFVPWPWTVSEPALRMSPSISAFVPAPTLAVAPSLFTATATDPARPGVLASAVLTDKASTSTACVTSVIRLVDSTSASTSASAVTAAVAVRPVPPPTKPMLSTSERPVAVFVPRALTVTVSALTTSPCTSALVAPATVAVASISPTATPTANATDGSGVLAVAEFDDSASTRTVPPVIVSCAPFATVASVTAAWPISALATISTALPPKAMATAKAFASALRVAAFCAASGLKVCTVRLLARTLAFSPTQARVAALMVAVLNRWVSATMSEPLPPFISDVASSLEVDETVTLPSDAVTSASSPM